MLSKTVTLLSVMNLLLVGAVVFLCGHPGEEPVVAADPPPRGLSTSAKIVEWYDADTATVDLTIRCRVRLVDCWAPEVRGKQKPEGLKSKQAMLEVCPNGSKVRLFIPATGRLQDSLTFGRVLGKIWVPDKDGKWIDVAEEMVRSGYATKEKVR